MSKLCRVTLRLLGAFAIEADIGRPIPIAVRSRKARALLAYLAMQANYRARREELAALFWGDNSDALARQSLRQCLNALRQDLRAASEALVVTREAIALQPEVVSVDARTFLAFARSATPDELAEAAALWRGSFLSDVALDIDEFDAWRTQEAERLAATAGGLFEALAWKADASGEGERAIAAAEQLVALEPAREDRQRSLLMLIARYRGREAALSRAKLLTGLLRRELDVAPEPATRVLVNEIRRGDFVPAGAPLLSGTIPVSPMVVHTTSEPAITTPSPLVVKPRDQVAAKPPLWRRKPLAAASAALAVLVLGLTAILAPFSASDMSVPRNPAIVVLPFTGNRDGEPDYAALPNLLTHNLVGYLSRFGNLRVISDQTTDLYRDRHVDVAKLITDVGAQYAIAGQILQADDGVPRIDVQLVDTSSRTNLWSDHLQREPGEPTLVADESARGIARMIAIEVDRLSALHVRAKPASQLTAKELVARGYLGLQRGATRDDLSDAMASFEEALQRNPRYEPARLAVARVRIIAVLNFIDFGPLPDLDEIERSLKDSLRRAPNSISALYSLALLQKYRRQYEASLRLLQRCLEINPSFLPAQGQIANILARSGHPQEALEQIRQTIRIASPNDPTMGYWYLFAAEAELELGHDLTALDWALRADTFMPGSPLVQAWLASIYTFVGDKSSAAKYVAALTQMAPDRISRFMKRPIEGVDHVDGQPRRRILDGLRWALETSHG